jgi:hypothetical protein
MTVKAAHLIRTGLLLGDASLYRVDPPMTYGDLCDEEDKGTTEFVIVSAVNVPFSGPETYIFPADSDGEVVDWLELDGSYRGGLDHEAALRGAGYEVLS